MDGNDNDAYWRNNAIEGLRAELEGTFDPPADPEEKERRDQMRARLAELEKEQAVESPRQIDFLAEEFDVARVFTLTINDHITSAFIGRLRPDPENPVERLSTTFPDRQKAEAALQRGRWPPLTLDL